MGRAPNLSQKTRITRLGSSRILNREGARVEVENGCANGSSWLRQLHYTAFGDPKGLSNFRPGRHDSEPKFVRDGNFRSCFESCYGNRKKCEGSKDSFFGKLGTPEASAEESIDRYSGQPCGFALRGDGERGRCGQGDHRTRWHRIWRTHTVCDANTVSTTDPYAVWAKKTGPATLAYFDHYLVDTPSRVILGGEATPALFYQETVAACRMLERVKQLGIQPQNEGADKAYGVD